METKTKVKIGEHEYEVKSDFTVEEEVDIEASYYDGAKYVTIGNRTEFENFNLARATFNKQKTLLSKAVLTIDGKNDDLIGKVVKLSRKEFDELHSKVVAIIDKKKA